jgi:hypothetical protein
MEELKEFNKNAIEEIYEKVMDLSGVDVTEKDVKNFPENE